MVLFWKFPCIESDGHLLFTDYSKVYNVQMTLSEIEPLEIKDILVDDTTIAVRVGLTPTSSMKKVAIKREYSLEDTSVADFMIPFLEKGNNNSIKIFLQVIKDIERKLIDGNPIDQLRMDLKSPEELLRRALLNHITDAKTSQLSAVNQDLE